MAAARRRRPRWSARWCCSRTTPSTDWASRSTSRCIAVSSPSRPTARVLELRAHRAAEHQQLLGHAAADHAPVVRAALADGDATHWFFIRYADPDEGAEYDYS